MSTLGSERKVHAASFDRAAEAYERGRPPYPPEVVPAGARRVLDLGAGTGKLTRVLVDAGLDVVAVEPSEKMREQLTASVPEAEALAGAAERIPLPDASVDAVVVAQAWHWVDPAVAVPEVARVLRPGGTLSLIWNVRDHREPWVARLDELLHRHTRAEIDTAPAVGAPFGDPERTEIRWTHRLTRGELLDMVASRSYVIVLPAAERARLLADVEALVGDAGEVEMPYVTHCTRVTRG
ncbi:class I SAM-dependent methyltransferase [Symbioplanes lichenis]|uniref:class I SAM-dependent methyltransferase n=1 Tax=Symbioplanes lichenis TaxID=1629072 RepID=UPI002739759B|nr:class I SAM-dependent methyltransferase [Actinoplanes lichenis]